METESKYIFTILKVDLLWEYKGRKVLFHVGTAVSIRLYFCLYYLLFITNLYLSHLYFVFYIRL